VAKDGSFKQ
jgi:hypothetical protein